VIVTGGKTERVILYRGLFICETQSGQNHLIRARAEHVNSQHNRIAITCMLIYLSSLLHDLKECLYRRWH